MKTWLYFALIAAMAATPASLARSDTITSTHGMTIGSGIVRMTGETIRRTHARSVTYTRTWLRERRYLVHPRADATVGPRRRPNDGSPNSRAAVLRYVGSGLYTLVPAHRYDYSCRYLADCPCRFLAGC